MYPCNSAQRCGVSGHGQAPVGQRRGAYHETPPGTDAARGYSSRSISTCLSRPPISAPAEPSRSTLVSGTGAGSPARPGSVAGPAPRDAPADIVPGSACAAPIPSSAEIRSPVACSRCSLSLPRVVRHQLGAVPGAADLDVKNSSAWSDAGGPPPSPRSRCPRFAPGTRAPWTPRHGPGAAGPDRPFQDPAPARPRAGTILSRLPPKPPPPCGCSPAPGPRRSSSQRIRSPARSSISSAR